MVTLINNNFQTILKSFCGKRDAFDCAGISKDQGSHPGTVESVSF